LRVMLLLIDTTQEHDYRPLLSQTEAGEAYDGSRSKGEHRHVFLVPRRGHDEQCMITTWLGNRHLIAGQTVENARKGK
jgi:hypothetical protein